MPRLAICNRDLHWHWINRTLLCDTMEVSMLSRAWLTIAQHVFQPALTGRPELIPRKIVSGELGTKVIAVSRFREKLSPANWVQGVTAISRKISRSWAPKKWGPTCDRDISNSAIYTTAIYRAYTVLGFRLLLYQIWLSRMIISSQVTKWHVASLSREAPVTCSFCWCTGKLEALMLSSPPPLKHNMSSNWVFQATLLAFGSCKGKVYNGEHEIQMNKSCATDHTYEC